MDKKRVKILGFAVLVVCGCTSKRPDTQAIQKIFSDKPVGAFRAYSDKELKKMKLKSGDFAAEINSSLIDRRLKLEMTEQHQKKYLFDSGVFELNETVSLSLLNKNELRIQHEMEIINGEKSKKITKTSDCNEEKISLSSGVVQRELKCSNSNVMKEAEDIGVEIAYCMIETLGTRPIKTDFVFGQMSFKDTNKAYSRVTKEIKIISGEVVCNGDRKGLGAETRITYYTNEEPNVSYPAMGTHKILFQSRSIVKANREIVYKSSDELLEPAQLKMQTFNNKQEIKKKQTRTDRRKKIIVSRFETN